MAVEVYLGKKFEHGDNNDDSDTNLLHVCDLPWLIYYWLF